jgi:hypothetical protein
MMNIPLTRETPQPRNGAIESSPGLQPWVRETNPHIFSGAPERGRQKCQVEISVAPCGALEILGASCPRAEALGYSLRPLTGPGITAGIANFLKLTTRPKALNQSMYFGSRHAAR